MKPRPFDYIRPETLDEALRALDKRGEEARVLAGGQSLVAMLNLRLVDASALIDISGLKELSDFRVHNGAVEVGAAVTQNRLLHWPDLAKHAPLLAKMLPWVGHFQTRNRGTVCGSIAHSDPSSELPLALAMLGGEVVLRSRRATRTLKASEFQLGPLTTAREPNEMITMVRFPVHPPRVAFREVARRHGDFAIVGVAAMVKDSGVRIGIGGAHPTPFVREVKSAAEIEALVWEMEPGEDIHATAHMRRDLVRGLAPLVIEDARA